MVTLNQTDVRVFKSVASSPEPVTAVDVARDTRLTRPQASSALGNLKRAGLVAVVRAVTEPNSEVVWTSTPSVVGRGVDGFDAVNDAAGRLRFIPRGRGLEAPAPQASAVKADAMDAWLSSLPAAAPEAKPTATGSLIWTYDGARFAAAHVERGEGTVTLQRATVLRPGFLFTKRDERFPFLVLKETSVIGMAPMIEQDQG